MILKMQMHIRQLSSNFLIWFWGFFDNTKNLMSDYNEQNIFELNVSTFVF